MTFQIQSHGGLHPHLPAPLLDGMQSSIDLEMIMEPMNRHDDLYVPGQTLLGGFFLPPFQRPAVWTREQQTRFVESALLGVTLGTLVVVDAINLPMRSDGRFPATDRWLLDGQQRVTALLAYRASTLEPFDGTECAHRWSDLSVVERRKVWHIQIGIFRVRTDDEAYCREIYNRMNFGGTAHTDGQQA